MNRPIAVGIGIAIIGIAIIAIVGFGFNSSIENDVQKETESIPQDVEETESIPQDVEETESIPQDVEDVGQKLSLKLSDKVTATEKTP